MRWDCCRQRFQPLRWPIRRRNREVEPELSTGSRPPRPGITPSRPPKRIAPPYLQAPWVHASAREGRYIAGRRRHGRGRAGPGGPGAPRPLKFAGGDAFWQMLWWGILSDVPTGLERIDCPVILAQGTADLVAAGQTQRCAAAGSGALPDSVYEGSPQ
jgi:pimeloyl-ACP methyl ester carboxylesterase